jgi:hypothetical protein
MVKMVELIVTDADGRVLNRVAVNEDLFEEVLRRVSERPHDLATAWWLRILKAIFDATTAPGSVTALYVDTTGTSRAQNFKASVGTYYLFFNTSTCSNRLWVVCGDSSTAPTRSDYKLGNKLEEGVAGIAIDENAGILTISGSFTFATNTVVYEVGLEWEGAVESSGTCRRVLLDRTVILGGIAVAAGQTLTVIYRFIFP